ncbi:MAG: 16S rRNA (uracil(1498)-N(3))-methyltransferase [Acholeplasmatales bacterium]|jgi:16S rRNA (uracil1498-N3)-methyltransferase|nr:16S rRNA (uracil(1498)-N(3))-methyltransferase [Acholeplasmatales bacterium]MBQ4357445.1 16S rRNA (uracil(1498)-N(3))-methyltransferase [Acholeplasmatales bacterium]
MQKYFITTKNLSSGVILGDDAYQIQTVLRYKGGEKIMVSDSNKTYYAKINTVTKDEVTFEILEEKAGNTELPVFVSIFQGYPKGDKMEEIIKHGTELGAKEIIPTFMKRSIVKLEEKKINSKLERFRKIAKEAAEQSYRDSIPNIPSIPYLKTIDFSSFDVKIVCYEESAKNGELKAFKSIISNLSENMRVACVIGPEGGIDDAELEYLKALGFIPCALGPRILRTETAVFYILSAISYEMELKK